MPLRSRLIFLLSSACFFLFSTSAFAATETDLLADQSLKEWRFFSPQGGEISQIFKFLPDGTLSVAGKPNGYLVTKADYENYSLHVEWRWLAPKGNSGVLVHVIAPDKLWPTCMQFQTKIGSVGEWIPMSDFKTAETLAPGAKAFPKQAPDAEKPVGEWNSADIISKDGVLECYVNGKLMNRVTKCAPAKGTIGFQLEGAPFEMRKFILKR